MTKEQKQEIDRLTAAIAQHGRTVELQGNTIFLIESNDAVRRVAVTRGATDAARVLLGIEAGLRLAK